MGNNGRLELLVFFKNHSKLFFAIAFAVVVALNIGFFLLYVNCCMKMGRGVRLQFKVVHYQKVRSC